MTRSRIIMLLTRLTLAAAACSCDAEDTAAAADELEVRTTTVTFAPGEERYLCWSLKIPEGKPFELSGVDFEVSDDVHHYQLDLRAEVPPKEPWDCGFGEGGPPPDGEPAGDPPPFMMPTMVAVGGPGTPRSVRFPEKTAAILDPGIHLVMQLHIMNASTERREFGPSVARLRRTNAAPEEIAPVGVLLVNDNTVTIPPMSKDVNAGLDCTLPSPLENVFQVWPHMHLLGKHIEVEVGDKKVVSTAWDFSHQLLFPTDIGIAKGDSIRLRCSFDNPTERTVHFGMSTNDEMCTTFVYYYPAVKGFGACEKNAPQ